MFFSIFRIGNDSAKINSAQIFSQEIYKYFYISKRFFDNPPRCSPQRVDNWMWLWFVNENRLVTGRRRRIRSRRFCSMATQLATLPASVDKSGKAWQQQVAGQTVHSSQFTVAVVPSFWPRHALNDWMTRQVSGWPARNVSFRTFIKKNVTTWPTQCAAICCKWGKLTDIARSPYAPCDLRLCCIIFNVRFPTAIGNLHTAKGSRQQDVRLRGSQNPLSMLCKYLCSTFWRAKINFTTISLCVYTMCVCVCL